MKFSTKFEVRHGSIFRGGYNNKRGTPILILFLKFRAFPLSLTLFSTNIAVLLVSFGFWIET